MGVLLLLILGIGFILFRAKEQYTVAADFTSLPLQYDPDGNTSRHLTQAGTIVVEGGFVKGLLQQNGKEIVLIRALSPLPSVSLEGSDASAEVTIELENIRPEMYADRLSGETETEKTAQNALRFVLGGSSNKLHPKPWQAGESFTYVVLGDNRDGYDTFSQMINRINGLQPAFVIDNGDLVFNGEANQYRLFDHMVSGLESTLTTTLGNHDIRGSGRNTYTMLYGPAYYSFDYGDRHFAFLDSSPGWAEKTAISVEQYEWLERDLEKAKGKTSYVITHIPPVDPRAGVKPNEIAHYKDQARKGDNAAEQVLDNYYDNMEMDHGFQDPAEARRFEDLMDRFDVKVVYLSHIHSYMEYTRDDVRYLISGGAGAELLTKDSYYHFLLTRTGDTDTETMVEFTSPANTYLGRYAAAATLFANAFYRENPAAVILLAAGIILLFILVLLQIFLWKQDFFRKLRKWLTGLFAYAAKSWKQT